MKKTILLFLLAIGLSAAAKPVVVIKETQWLENWLAAWELLSTDVLKIKPSNTPEMLFFDKDYVYTTSIVSAPKGTLFKGPSLFGKALTWRRAKHNGVLTLPTGDKISPGIMAFAGALKTGDNQSFFVMAAPSFWKEAGVKNEKIGLENMLTGVFLHEFAHSQQLEGFGRQVGEIEQAHKFQADLNDNIVEDRFKNDQVFSMLIEKELTALDKAIYADRIDSVRMIISKVLHDRGIRSKMYFKGEDQVLGTLDPIFLSMEGLGQFAAVSWLMHPAGGKLTYEQAVSGFSKKGGSWSQEESLRLFLVLHKLGTTDWQESMFSRQPVSIIQLLDKALKNR